ncbi:XrtA/PEP-CTERM system-associated ATPase [Tsuneonella mangrovi]|uniref:XrtA/PEP-CTERM system-associated ATPase n=1 Tax=Tsuneonella mangrovi TaxID=1982042 RepID=UPI000BA20108|nr:XrtA/PEP-CTERM system-associated ATPase [Tsuneonella mangrovi]
MFDDFYKLTARPFQLTPDPDFYFESATHRKALSYLGYGMAQGEGFIVITGEVGAGKSTLVAHLMKKIDPAQMTVGQIVTSNLDGEEMVHVAAQAFGIEVDGHDKAAALGAIENFLHEEARAGRRCLLIVDESQNLSVEALEELRMLSNFQLGSHPLLQTLLLGQPEFKQVLAQHSELEQLRQRVIAAHHLEAMGAAEIQPYIEHRLECVGWEGNPAFDQRVFAELHEATGGIPRRVNQVMTRLMLLGAVEQRTRIDSAMLSAVLKEMEHDSTFPEAMPKPLPKIDVAPTPGPIKHAVYPSAAPKPRVEELLATRDGQIAQLQQAIAELSDARTNGPSIPTDWFDRVAELERRISEQDKAVREVLSMLIEWFEEEMERKAA